MQSTSPAPGRQDAPRPRLSRPHPRQHLNTEGRAGQTQWHIFGAAVKRARSRSVMGRRIPLRTWSGDLPRTGMDF